MDDLYPLVLFEEGRRRTECVKCEELMVVRVMSGLIGLATLSVGFITAAYYILSSLSRYVVRLFSSRSNREAKKLPVRDTPIISQEIQSNSKLAKPNGVVTNIRSTESHNQNQICQNSSLQPQIGPNPEDFEKFIGHDVIMKFEGQRQVKFQFFVVLLASEDDLRDLSCITFHPHNPSSPWQPLIDNRELTMPSADCYGNYIVARFESCQYHSEEVVFGPKYDNPFSQLWSAYLRKNDGNQPKSIVMYSWNFPCARCTELIVRILSEQRYSGVHVLIAYSRIWDSEEGYPEVAERNKKEMRDRICGYIQQVEPPVPLQEAGLESEA